MIDVWCTRPHYAAHLRPLFDALPVEAKGAWFGPLDDPDPGGRARALLVGAYRDLDWMRARYPRLALVEHGIGQTYSDALEHPAYPGGIRNPYDLLLAPGPHVVDRAARETILIGCTAIVGREQGVTGRSRMAISFHWDCGVSPEAGTGFWEYLPFLEDQAARVGGLLVHAHPLIQDDVFEQLTNKVGLVACPDFDQILDEAAVYAVDNSSTLFEFAALDRPVVVLNPAAYRRAVRHGKRFWDWADVGINVDHPSQLAAAYKTSVGEDPNGARRRDVVGECFVGNTAEGVQALLRLCG